MLFSTIYHSRIYISLLAVLVLPIHAVQAQKTYKHGVFWGRIVLADTISKKIKWELYLQKRTQNIPGHTNILAAPHFFSAWAWLNYQISPDWKLSVSPIGYFNSNLFFTTADNADDPGVKEFRWTARAEFEKKTWLNYANRYSLEYRKRDLLHNGDYQPNWRVRYQLRLEKPVKGLLSRSKPVSFSLADEIFIQFGKAVKGNANVFDQNRIVFGVSYEVLRNIKATVNYLNIRQQRINGKDFDNANALWIVLTFDNLISQFWRKTDQQTTTSTITGYSEKNK